MVARVPARPEICPAIRAATARTVAAVTAHRSHGFQDGVRSSRTNAHAPVTATPAGSAHAQARDLRWAPVSRTAPAPVSAAIAGAMAVE